MRTIAEVVEDIKNGTWGSDVEYQSECEKLHKLCDEILEIEKAKAKRIVAELEDKLLSSSDAHAEAITGMCGASANVYYGEKSAYTSAIDIVRKGGVE